MCSGNYNFDKVTCLLFHNSPDDLYLFSLQYMFIVILMSHHISELQVVYLEDIFAFNLPFIIFMLVMNMAILCVNSH
jgi:hypothetical protein